MNLNFTVCIGREWMTHYIHRTYSIRSIRSENHDLVRGLLDTRAALIEPKTSSVSVRLFVFYFSWIFWNPMRHRSENRNEKGSSSWKLKRCRRSKSGVCAPTDQTFWICTNTRWRKIMYIYMRCVVVVAPFPLLQLFASSFRSVCSHCIRTRTRVNEELQ